MRSITDKRTTQYCVETALDCVGGDAMSEYRRLKDLTRKERRELNRIVRKQRKERKGYNESVRPVSTQVPPMRETL